MGGRGGERQAGGRLTGASESEDCETGARAGEAGGSRSGRDAVCGVARGVCSVVLEKHGERRGAKKKGTAMRRAGGGAVRAARSSEVSGDGGVSAEHGGVQVRGGQERMSEMSLVRWRKRVGA